MSDTLPGPIAHTVFEDIQALLVAPLFMALAVVFFRQAGLLTGGSAGLAFLLHYLSGWRFGLLFFLLNLPFYIFAIRSLGWLFTLKTFAAIALLSLYSEFLPRLIQLDLLHPVFAAIMGGLLAGISLLILIRHKASLGGLGVLAIFLQERYGISAGKFQMGADCAIVLAAFFVVDPWHVTLSILGAVALNLVIAVNHKPGRYMGI
ncbi:YitT family protein [Uliginosibacterium sp. 31-16]|uniref:YitT family protein n=1 Tax=Uliginosibacterium sp. 31-16 TaxID=3068315 RepID=UPI00273E6DE9|nr:YitT family protein [Uliginosibacterium sp. 31-16]MDP5239697.1 YitT family protein [Uliginosibacterium sp. 31-16]